MMMALFPTLKGAARPITTPITTYHIKHAPATSHKNQVNSLYICIGYKNIPVNLGGTPKAIQAVAHTCKLTLSAASCFIQRA